MPKSRIIPQMFDVRPVKKTGDLDWEKIKMVGGNENEQKVKNYKAIVEQKNFIQIAKVDEYEIELQERIKKSKLEDAWKKAANSAMEYDIAWLKNKEKAKESLHELNYKQSLVERIRSSNVEKKNKEYKDKFSFFGIFMDPSAYSLTPLNKTVPAFALFVLLILAGISGGSFAYKGFGIKGKVLGVSQDGYESISKAVSAISKSDFEKSTQSFEEAVKFFSEASYEMDKIGNLLNKGSRFFPYVSKISSGKNIIESGKYLSSAAVHMNEAMKYLYSLKDEGISDNTNTSMIDIFEKMSVLIESSRKDLLLANEAVDKVKVGDLPEEMKENFLLLKSNLPRVIAVSDAFLENSSAFSDMLGANGPRKYLFLFQNNNEMRATGGFIGSYGLLDIKDGRVRNFFIDGIYNPDGQLTEKIVPPKPIQKISAAWSLHDSNWFPDFPTSAQKAITFYEKTGGPTADGIISVTPIIMERLLEITGPIEMEEYGMILDSHNFIENVQYEVDSHNEIKIEDDKDKDAIDDVKNDPKKILSDLAPKVLDKILSTKDHNMILKVASVFMEGLSEKHILIYSQNDDLQKIISQRNWSGEIIESNKDYISVINTNINGYKTDGVIDEKIIHEIEISENGSIINTVSVIRKHNGGNTKYEWWNKVNANYMRVYVPLGAKLLEVEGQTREINESPLDYDKLGFKRDPLVQMEEESMIIDNETGTRIYEENGKTVFANWVYVSPQETVTITYKYELPFKLFPEVLNSGENVDSYSIVVQKQSGSRGSSYVSTITYPDSYHAEWIYPNSIENESRRLRLTSTLNTDKFIGVAFKKK